VLHDLRALWLRRERQDEYVGTLVNAYLAEGGEAAGVRAGAAYVDVGTFDGYRAAMELLGRASPEPAGFAPPPPLSNRLFDALSPGAGAGE